MNIQRIISEARKRWLNRLCLLSFSQSQFQTVCFIFEAAAVLQVFLPCYPDLLLSKQLLIGPPKLPPLPVLYG